VLGDEDDDEFSEDTEGAAATVAGGGVEGVDDEFCGGVEGEDLLFPEPPPPPPTRLPPPPPANKHAALSFSSLAMRFVACLSAQTSWRRSRQSRRTSTKFSPHCEKAAKLGKKRQSRTSEPVRGSKKEGNECAGGTTAALVFPPPASKGEEGSVVWLGAMGGDKDPPCVPGGASNILSQPPPFKKQSFLASADIPSHTLASRD